MELTQRTGLGHGDRACAPGAGLRIALPLGLALWAGIAAACAYLLG